LDEGISGKVISGIGGSFRRNPQLRNKIGKLSKTEAAQLRMLITDMYGE
jgi:hypothetical protein